MLQRVGICIDDNDLKHIKLLQKRLGIRSRSELFRELIRRYEQLEEQRRSLDQCVRGYLKDPETGGEEAKLILKTAAQGHASEDWT